MDKLIDKYKGHTPGPCTWYVCTTTQQVYLCTPDRGMLYVLGFERWGMQQAKPTFRNNELCLMTPLQKLIEVDHNNCTYEIKHPDAQLIADAPALLARIEALETENAELKAKWEKVEGRLREEYQSSGHHRSLGLSSIESVMYDLDINLEE